MQTKFQSALHCMYILIKSNRKNRDVLLLNHTFAHNQLFLQKKILLIYMSLRNSFSTKKIAIFLFNVVILEKKLT